MPNVRPGGEDRNERIEEMLENMPEEIKESIKDYFELRGDDLATHFDERIDMVDDSVTELLNRPDETQEIKDCILDLEHGVEEIKYDMSSLEGLHEKLTNLEMAIEENELKNDNRTEDLQPTLGDIQSTLDHILRALRSGPERPGA